MRRQGLASHFFSALYRRRADFTPLPRDMGLPSRRTTAVLRRLMMFDYFEACQSLRFALPQSLAGKLHGATTSSKTKFFTRATGSASSRVFAFRMSSRVLFCPLKHSCRRDAPRVDCDHDVLRSPQCPRLRVRSRLGSASCSAPFPVSGSLRFWFFVSAHSAPRSSCMPRRPSSAHPESSTR